MLLFDSRDSELLLKLSEECRLLAKNKDLHKMIKAKYYYDSFTSLSNYLEIEKTSSKKRVDEDCSSTLRERLWTLYKLVPNKSYYENLEGVVIVLLGNTLVYIIYIVSEEWHNYGPQGAIIVRPHILSSTAPLVMYKNARYITLIF